MLKWLNPANWIKSAIYAKIEKEVRTRTSKDALVELGRNAVNYLIQLAASKVDADKSKAISNDLIFCGNALSDLGTAIDPESEDGCQLSASEIDALNARVKVLFGDVITDWQLDALRDKALGLVREKLEGK